MYTLNCNGRLLVIDKPIVMGIINATPDSFYSGSRISLTDGVLKKVEQMVDDGATIIDVGGQSTRPGSTQIPAEEEAKRVLPAIEQIAKAFPNTFISVDTFYALVAKQAVEAGACIVNDISSGDLDNEMIKTVGGLKVPYIVMHMKGTPQDMQENPGYEDVITEVLDYMIKKVEACKLAGIHDVIVDPGFGFGKTAAHNFRLLQQLNVFKMLQKPILAGISRKGTIYKTLGTTAEEALNGTTVLNTIALLNGASILRVHDVKEAVEAINLVDAYMQT
jgi:dihydropteroate synthase